MLLSVFCAS